MGCASFEAAGVPVGPVNRIGDMLTDPQVAAREMVVEVDHPRGRTHEDAGPADQVLRHPGRASTRAAPVLGQHTREVLLALGYSTAEIERLQQQGAIHCA